MTAHDDVKEPSEHPTGPPVQRPSDDDTQRWIGPGATADGGAGRRAHDGEASVGAAAPAYDDGDSRIFLEGDG